MTEHIVSSTIYIMSSAVYDRLPQEAKDALDAAHMESLNRTIELYNTLWDDLRGRMEAAGTEFIEVDKSTFIEAAKETPALFPEWDGGYEMFYEFFYGNS
jgi:TRAP-type C4-dicarboxylate transport system substrate-binding protein